MLPSFPDYRALAKFRAIRNKEAMFRLVGAIFTDRPNGAASYNSLTIDAHIGKSREMKEGLPAPLHKRRGPARQGDFAGAESPDSDSCA